MTETTEVNQEEVKLTLSKIFYVIVAIPLVVIGLTIGFFEDVIDSPQSLAALGAAFVFLIVITGGLAIIPGLILWAILFALSKRD